MLSFLRSFLIAFMLVALCAPAQAAESYQFTFGKIEAERDSWNPFASVKYYTVEFVEGRGIIADSFAAPDLTAIATYLGYKRPEDMAGKSFTSHLKNRSDALGYIKMQAAHYGKYTPPTRDEFLDKLAKGLIDTEYGKCPRVLSMADPDTTRRIMEEAFPQGCRQDINPKFEADLNERIGKFSNGRLRIVKAKSREINGMASMCGGEYYFVQNGDKPLAKFLLDSLSDGMWCSTDWEPKIGHPPASESGSPGFGFYSNNR